MTRVRRRIDEMISQHLKKIGIQIDVLEQERTLMERRRDGNELQTVLWANDGSKMIYSYPPHALPMRPDVFMGNVPSRQMNAMHCRTPCSSHPPTLFFKS